MQESGTPIQNEKQFGAPPQHGNVVADCESHYHRFSRASPFLALLFFSVRSASPSRIDLPRVRERQRSPTVRNNNPPFVRDTYHYRQTLYR